MAATYRNGFFREDRLEDGETNRRTITSNRAGAAYRGFLIFKANRDFHLVFAGVCIAMRGGKAGCERAVDDLLDRRDTFDAARLQLAASKNGVRLPVREAA